MRILWLKTELLHPVDKGGRIRTYQMLRALCREHEITYLTLDDGTADPDALERAREYARAVETIPIRLPPRGSPRYLAAVAGSLRSSLPYAIARYRSPAFERAVERLSRARRFDVIVADFLVAAVNLPTGLPCATVLFQHNVEAEIWRRHAEVAADPVRRTFFRGQWRRMVRFEAAACRRFDVVAAVSDQDAHHFRTLYGVPVALPIPTGVDTEFFAPVPASARDRDHLVFTGSMDWMPNEEGLLFFLAAVLPLVRAQRPGVRLTIVGRSPSAHLLAAAASQPGVTVTGRVEDVRPYLARASAAIVPLRVGGGTRLKIFEALAMGCPVVSTTIGAEGLPLTANEHLLIADDAQSQATACVRLLEDPALAAGVGATGATFVRQQFGWPAVAHAFALACQEAVARHAGRPERGSA